MILDVLIPFVLSLSIAFVLASIAFSFRQQKP
jgi:hypothetical protein